MVNDWNTRINRSLEQERSVFQRYADVNLVERDNMDKEVNAVPTGPTRNDDYEIINVTVDSGAYNTVGPPHVGTYFKIGNTEASQSGQHYRAANGTVIKNYGQRIIRGTNEVGAPVNMPIQVADVNKVLGSVREMVKAGNKVVFDEDVNGKSCSYVEHKKTGRMTIIHDNGGNFQFTIKVPKGEG